MLEGVLQRGEATWSNDLLLMLERSGYPEECYFTFSYSPIRDEPGNVAGVFTPVADTTERVNMGPRSDQFILVRVHEQSTQPFALTGNAERPRPVRHVPSHMKGTHGPF